MNNDAYWEVVRERDAERAECEKLRALLLRCKTYMNPLPTDLYNDIFDALKESK
jgi:hypothetical protein